MSFQFTHPGKGATLKPIVVINKVDSFNSRTLGRVRLYTDFKYLSIATFQFTHPGKGATSSLEEVRIKGLFQFTHPGKGATNLWLQLLGKVNVSIHAPREGCDRARGADYHKARRFNSRTPGGVRRSGA